MKKFLSVAFGAFVGSFVAIFFAMIVYTILSVIMLISSIAALNISGGKSSQVNISDNSVLKINLSGEFGDRANSAEMDFTYMLNDEEPGATYGELVKALELAKSNENIKGVVLRPAGLACGAAKAYEIRKAIADFKEESGKWIYAYADSYSQSEYYIASLADSIMINHEGMVDLHGMGTLIPYFKRLLDKLGVKMEVFKVGTFKSAVEPFILEHSSKANIKQNEQFLGDIWSVIAGDLSQARNIQPRDLDAMINDFVMLASADTLIAKNIVDRKIYEFQFEKVLKSKLGIDDEEDINFISVKDLASTEDDNFGKSKIAVLYAQGEITTADSENNIDYKKINEAILSAAKDDEVMGMVMRVNSPGGSAFDSEQMWAAIQEFKNTGKPFAVSMGDYAASGGYYISCSAHRIFAQPTTLTGSIGIYGMMPNFSQLAQNVGVNFESISTHHNFMSYTFNGMDNNFRAKMQGMVNRGYELFTNRCATGRHMPVDSLKMIAEGRVWSGLTAIKIGLVDELGGLQDAVEWVAESAGLDPENVYTEALPNEEEDFMKMFKGMLKRKISFSLGSDIDRLVSEKEKIERLMKDDPVQARMVESYIW